MRQAEGCAQRLAAPACRCRSTSACATGIRISPTRSRRCRAPASAARSASSPPRTAATRAARSIARTSPTRARPRARGPADVEVTYAPDWHEHPPFIDANAERVAEALATLRPALRDRAQDRVHRAQHSGNDGGALSATATVRGDGAVADDGRRAGRSRRAPWRAGLSEPQRTAGGSVARAGHLRLPARGARAKGSRPRSSCRSASSAITSRCSTTSTSKPRRCAARSACRWHAPRRSTTTRASSTCWPTWCCRRVPALRRSRPLELVAAP